VNALQWFNFSSKDQNNNKTSITSTDNIIPTLLPAPLHAAQACRYLIYSAADFEVFRPAGATLCTDGVKFSMPNFTPIGATTSV